MTTPSIQKAKQYGYVDADGKTRWFHFEWRYVGTTNVPDEKAARKYVEERLAEGRRSGVLAADAEIQLVSRTHVRTVWTRTLSRIEREGAIR